MKDVSDIIGVNNEDGEKRGKDGAKRETLSTLDEEEVSILNEASKSNIFRSINSSVVQDSYSSISVSGFGDTDDRLSISSDWSMRSSMTSRASTYSRASTQSCRGFINQDSSTELSGGGNPGNISNFEWGYLVDPTDQVSVALRDCSEMGEWVGRDSSCHVVVDDSKVSAFHCRIFKDGSEAFVEDWSTNGTFVNGKRQGRGIRLLIKTGDRISLNPEPFEKVFIFNGGSDDWRMSGVAQGVVPTTRPREPRPKQSPSRVVDKSEGALHRAFMCHICTEVLHRCVTVVPCGHNFCAFCLGQWQRSGSKLALLCPLCQRSKPAQLIYINHAFRTVIQDWISTECNANARRDPAELRSMDRKSCLKDTRLPLFVGPLDPIEVEMDQIISSLLDRLGPDNDSLGSELDYLSPDNESLGSERKGTVLCYPPAEEPPGFHTPVIAAPLDPAFLDPVPVNPLNTADAFDDETDFVLLELDRLLALIHKLRRTKDTRFALRPLDVIKEIIIKFRTRSDAVELLGSAAKVLAFLSALCNASQRRRLAVDGVYPLVLSLLASFSNDETIAWRCADVVGNITTIVRDAAETDLVSGNSISVICRVIVAQQRNEKVIQAAVYMIKSMSRMSSLIIRQQMEEHNVKELIQQLPTLYASNSKIVANSHWILGYLTDQNLGEDIFDVP